MAELIYSMLVSLDGYTEDEHGGFGWGAPEDEEVHSYINELASPFGTYPVRTEDVRDNGVLRDRAHGSRSITVRAPRRALEAKDEVQDESSATRSWNYAATFQRVTWDRGPQLLAA
jgi:hypothetical protein